MSSKISYIPGEVTLLVAVGKRDEAPKIFRLYVSQKIQVMQLYPPGRADVYKLVGMSPVGDGGLLKDMEVYAFSEQ